MEALRALLGGHPRQRLRRRRAGFALIPEEFDIAAERDHRNLPAGAVTVIEAGDFGTKSQRKGENPHPCPAGHQEVPELMKEHDNRQNEQERNDIADQSVA